MNISGVGAGSQQLYELQPAHRSQPSFSDTAQLLGMSSQQLQTDLQSGTTLSSLAQQKGVSSSDLLASVEQDLQANAPQGASGLSSTQAQQMATNLINGTPPQSPTGGAGAYGRDGQGGFRLQPPSFSDTAQLLGISSQQLRAICSRARPSARSLSRRTSRAAIYSRASSRTYRQTRPKAPPASRAASFNR